MKARNLDVVPVRAPGVSLKLHAPRPVPAGASSRHGPSAACLLIGGRPARIIVWSAEAWSRIEGPRPSEVFETSDGSMVALQIA